MKVYEVFSPTEYGYWLSPKGELIAVDPEEHEEWMHDQLEGEYEESDGDRVPPVHEAAYKLGWVRIITAYNQVVLEGRAQDLDTHLPQLLKLVKKTNPESVSLGVLRDDGTMGEPDPFMWPRERGDMIRYIKS